LPIGFRKGAGQRFRVETIAGRREIAAGGSRREIAAGGSRRDDDARGRKRKEEKRIDKRRSTIVAPLQSTILMVRTDRAE
jgi:hypothetical protein